MMGVVATMGPRSKGYDRGATFLPVTRGAGGAAFRQSHEIFGWALVSRLLLHIGVALWHYFTNRDTVLVRMAPAFAEGKEKWP